MLKTDYKDDVLNTDANVNRKFSIVRSNGTVVEQNVELRETTAFKQTGDSFGAKDINATNTAINDVTSKLQNLQIGGRNYLGNFNKIIINRSDYDSLNGGTFIDRTSRNIHDGVPQITAYKENKYLVTLNTFNAMIGTKQTCKVTIDDTFNRLQFKFNNSVEDANISWDVSALEKGEYIFSFAVVKPSDSGKASGMTAKYIKLEKGNVPTDWTPAPEDLIDTSITNSDIDTILNS